MKKPIIKIESYINDETKGKIETILKTVCGCLNVFRVRVREEENEYILHFYFENGFNFVCRVDEILLNDIDPFICGRRISDNIKDEYLLEKGLTH